MNTAFHPFRISALLLFSLSSNFWSSAATGQEQLPVCQMIATGGTIAMKIDPVKNAPVPALSGDDLVAGVPELANVAKVRVENPFNIPSAYMDSERWVAIHKLVVEALASDEVAGVMISHGTDTLEETAYFLDLTVSSEKPIVLVGAQRNASERDFDGPRNLLNAARICVSRHFSSQPVLTSLPVWRAYVLAPPFSESAGCAPPSHNEGASQRPLAGCVDAKARFWPNSASDLDDKSAH